MDDISLRSRVAPVQRARFESVARHARFVAKNAFHAHVELREGRRTCLGRVLERHARSSGGRVALRFEDRVYTFDALNRAANRYASTFAELGARAGDVVALFMSNRPELLFALLGANKLGVAVALVDPASTRDALVARLGAERPRFLLAGGELVPAVERAAPALRLPRARILVQREEGDAGGAPLDGATESTARLLEARAANPVETASRGVSEIAVHVGTSGTTGPSRRVRMTNARVLRAARFFESAAELGPADVVYDSGMPLHHASGLLVGFASSLVAGATFAMRRRFSAKSHWDDVARFEATVFTYVGELCRYLLASPPHPLEHRHRVRAVLGAGLGLDAGEPFQRRFGIGQVFELYGSTDGNVGLVNLDGRPGMIGRLLPGQSVVRADVATGGLLRDARGRLVPVDPGEIGMLVAECERARALRRDVERAREAGAIVSDGPDRELFCTGDLVRLHAERYVSFVVRVSDAIVCHGELVSPCDVANVLHDFPGVRAVNVYGVAPPSGGGNVPMAALVVGDAFRVADLAPYVTERLAASLRPAFVRICRAMDTTGTHVQRRARLREEGYDPARAGGDPVYRLDPAAPAYEPMPSIATASPREPEPAVRASRASAAALR